ncbi:MAG: HAD family hydrolase, partial [Actinobacteria bacterium]|nr:HAD family hydrolase [Actinomycetota bacterium]NIU70458.1 HAD family hydrolase [Actinomycetota bacterium]NIV58548.1 HAD family hydrolase [Actinomycetota bacterium]NIV90106.1 HAD family hydrolase [Actinomycetota bacterium]NIW32343.1 HAD family hydrolase [Actinomycetota bacterium]
LLWERYLTHLAERIVERPVEVLPGVRALLDALDGHGDVGLGLLTGNILGGAELKLGSAGLW